METLKILILLTMLLVSVIIDIRHGKIPNYITLPAIFLGMVLNLTLYKLGGITDSIQGILVALGIFIIPYILGIVGGGDVKLMMAVGALKGVNFALYSSFSVIICGGIIALIIMIKIKVKVKDFFVKFGNFILQKKAIVIDEIELEENKNYFPYSIAIAIGVIITLCLELGGIYEK